MEKIIRVFKAVARPDRVADFREFFLNEAVAIVRRQAGLIDVKVGLPTAESPREFLMVTTWSSLQDLVGFTGPNWKEVVIDPAEAPLLEGATVSHFIQAPLSESAA